MGQLEDLQLFVTVVDQGSIARAAQELGIAKSAVSRRLSQLEMRYDVRLIDRHPGTWSITDAGKELYQRAVPMVSDAHDLETDFTHKTQNPKGPLRVTVAREFGFAFLNPMLLAFAKEHREIDLTLDFDDRVVDLESENYDLALRMTSQDPGETSQVKLGNMRHGLYASPGYLAKSGVPETPKDLKKHALLHYRADRRSTWAFEFQGRPTKVEFKPTLNSNNGLFLRTAAQQGHGIVWLPEFLAADNLNDGTLVRVLPEATFEEFGIHLIHSPIRRVNKRMRAFIAAAKAFCANFDR